MDYASVENMTEKLCSPAVTDIFKCLLCMTISYTTSIFNDFVKVSSIAIEVIIHFENYFQRMNIIFTPEKTYRYKPPPSLFETLAIWTGALKEDENDDEIWVSQKLFMLASAIIFSVIIKFFMLIHY